MKSPTVDASAPKHGGWQLGLVLALALAVRLFDLGWGLPTADRLTSYEVDEMTFYSMVGNFRPQHLQFHPREMSVPAFTAYTFAASLLVGKLTGYVELVANKTYYRQHPEQLARMLLIGRLQSVFFGLLAVLLIFYLTAALAPDRPLWVPLLAALLLALLPVHVAWSRYLSQYPPLMVWWLGGLWLLVRFTRAPSTALIVGAGAAFGGALATALNTVSVMPVLVVAPWLVGWGENGPSPARRVQWTAISLAVAAITMVLLHPYSLLDFKGFSEALSFAGGFGNEGDISRTRHFVFWLTSMTPHAVGWGIFLTGFLGIGHLLARRPSSGEWLLILAVVLQSVIAVKLGYQATSSRLLLLYVCLPVFAALLVGRLAAQPKMRPAAWALGLLAVSWSVLQVGWMQATWRTDNVRREASQWVAAHIPPGASIGLVEKQPYWASPDIVCSDYAYPEVMRRGWVYRPYMFDAKRLIAEPTDYIVSTDHELNYRRQRYQATKTSEFVGVLNQHYQLIARFAQRLPSPPLLPRFREFGNNLWMPTEIYIYQRRHGIGTK